MSLKTCANDINEQQVAEALQHLDWKGPGKYKLSSSNSLVTVPVGYLVLFGHNAQEARNIFGGSLVQGVLECDIYSADFKDIITLGYSDQGYSFSDWSNPQFIDKLGNQFSKILENFEWIQKPIVDQEKKWVTHVIECKIDGNLIVMCCTMKFRGNTFETIAWQTGKALYLQNKDKFKSFVNFHEFELVNYNQKTVYKEKDIQDISYGIGYLAGIPIGLLLWKSVAKKRVVVSSIDKIRAFFITAFQAILCTLKKIF